MCNYFARFQSTRPIRGATPPDPGGSPGSSNFNPRAPYGARRSGCWDHSPPERFQSTRPIRGATAAPTVVSGTVPISIHAPHTGRDVHMAQDGLKEGISIHAPHTGRDLSRDDTPYERVEFQSTRPIRGATPARRSRPPRPRYFNPRAPYGARPSYLCSSALQAPFQSTRPIRGATVQDDFRFAIPAISIHAPHTGRDLLVGAGRQGLVISIHAPHTGRDAGSYSSTVTLWAFQSTRPIRGATEMEEARLRYEAISIHAPHTGRDDSHSAGRPGTWPISIHAPHTGRDTQTPNY